MHLPATNRESNLHKARVFAEGLREEVISILPMTGLEYFSLSLWVWDYFFAWRICQIIIE
jgi:hypothetical protein